MNNKILEEKYVEFQIFQQQMEKLAQYGEELEQKRIQLILTKESIAELQNVKLDTEIQVPVAEGIFVKAKIAETSKFIVAAGSNTAVEKSREDVEALVRIQLEELLTAQAKLNERAAKIQESMLLIAKEVENVQQT